MSEYQEHDNCRGCGEALWQWKPPRFVSAHNEANCLAAKLDRAVDVFRRWDLNQMDEQDALRELEDVLYPAEVATVAKGQPS